MTKTADEVIADIATALQRSDGWLIEGVANQVLEKPVTYVGDSMFETK